MIPSKTYELKPGVTNEYLPVKVGGVVIIFSTIGKIKTIIYAHDLNSTKNSKYWVGYIIIRKK